MNKIEQIIQYWFGPSDGQTPTSAKNDNSRKWFMKSDQTDQEIRDQFQVDWDKAMAKEYDGWTETPRARLALIILLDQFSRNMFRGTAKSFSSDPFALELSLQGLDKGDDKELWPVEATFFYLPLEHSEDLRLQDRCVELFAELVQRAKDSGDPSLSYIQNAYTYAIKHRDVIKQFGRFPHRNDILDRPSTPEEEEFLKKPGSSF